MRCMLCKLIINFNGAYVPLQNTCNNVKEVCISIGRANFYFCVFLEHPYDCNLFFEETVGQKYLLHLSSEYGIKCLGKVCN